MLAVGAGALRPLTAGLQPENLNALVVDVAGSQVTTRVADTRIADSETTPLPGHVKWPLLVLGLSIGGMALLLLRNAHRNRHRGQER